MEFLAVNSSGVLKVWIKTPIFKIKIKHEKDVAGCRVKTKVFASGISRVPQIVEVAPRPTPQKPKLFK